MSFRWIKGTTATIITKNILKKHTPFVHPFRDYPFTIYPNKHSNYYTSHSHPPQHHHQDSSGLFGKLKQLTKLYGSAALVVYGLLGLVDFGLSFIAIYLVGEDHVRSAEDWLLAQLNWKRVLSNPTTESSHTHPESHVLDNNNKNNMLWTTAVVAYTIHKTLLLPVRLGLTAWVTPPLVRALKKRGWKVGRNLE